MHRLYSLLFPAAVLLSLIGVMPDQRLAESQSGMSLVSATHGFSSESSEVTAGGMSGPESEPAVADRSQSVGDSTSYMFILSVYCLLIVAASLIGGWLPSLIQLTHTRMQTIVSFVGGLMLGTAVFHLIPHAFNQLRRIDDTMLWVMCGILLMFFLIRTFHFHNHGIAEEAQEDACDPCVQDHSHSHGHVHSHPQAHQLSWVGILVGLSIHTMLDGIALGSAVDADSLSLLPGIGVFLAVLLHKPLDAVSIATLMAVGGWTRKQIYAVNAGFALMCPVGAGLFLMGIRRFPGLQQEFAGAAMAFSAGVFLCIALSDLLPEMEFHSHHRLRLSVVLCLGIFSAWAIRHVHG
ncbi:MAG: ZIP family metal transporter [Fuerstiella sp.]|nr:ZIP family metal transporter [Fuerstiella sp.]